MKLFVIEDENGEFYTETGPVEQYWEAALFKTAEAAQNTLDTVKTYPAVPEVSLERVRQVEVRMKLED